MSIEQEIAYVLGKVDEWLDCTMEIGGNEDYNILDNLTEILARHGVRVESRK